MRTDGHTLSSGPRTQDAELQITSMRFKSGPHGESQASQSYRHILSQDTQDRHSINYG